MIYFGGPRREGPHGRFGGSCGPTAGSSSVSGKAAPKAVAALPTSVYVWRSVDEIGGLTAAGFATDL
jgi:hypothetical protein